MQIIVAKFGGTSVSSRETWENIFKITQEHINSGLLPVLVCSARSQASNMLEKLIQLALNNSHSPLLDEFINIHYDLAKELDISHDIIAPDVDLLQQLLT